MTERMLTEYESELCDSVSFLDPSTWPNELSPEYGENELHFLCAKFSVSFRAAKNAYQNFKDSRGKNKCFALQTYINAIPVSTAECERGFSKMNIVCSPVRSRLTVFHMSSLMFVSLTGPPLTLWQPLQYVKSWLASTRRDAICTQGLSTASRQVSQPVSAQEMSVWKVL